MTTLREMILTRPRQRGELLCILLDFSYYERSDLKAQSLETAKELFQFEAIRPDVKVYIIIKHHLIMCICYRNMLRQYWNMYFYHDRPLFYSVTIKNEVCIL
jgi:hypothetical protein